MYGLEGQSATLDAEPPGIRQNNTQVFRDKYFPGAKDSWDNWAWQLTNRITDKEQLSYFLQLSDDESSALDKLESLGRMTVNVTPYYLSLISEDDANQPLRRTIVPTMAELDVGQGESEDPLHEECDSPVPKIVHRYTDRALILTTGLCSSYCRYCTRSRLIGSKNTCTTTTLQFEEAFDYIREHDEIRDVILSGGDPLLLSNWTLDWILTELRAIPHVEIIRIGTKVPVVLPQRITPTLCGVLHKHHPLFMSIHFTHPDECTSECARACASLADAGIPLGSQTVLLAGINDDIKTMKSLMHALLMMRVKP
jgi:lysine 2,3-aminomutase